MFIFKEKATTKSAKLAQKSKKVTELHRKLDDNNKKVEAKTIEEERLNFEGDAFKCTKVGKKMQTKGMNVVLVAENIKSKGLVTAKGEVHEI